MKRTLASLAPILLAIPAQAVVWADDVSDQDVLDLGTAARFAGVGSTSTGGTATYIGAGGGRSWIITANHVINLGQTVNFNTPERGDFVAVGRLSFEDGGYDITVAELVDPGAAFGGVYAPSLNLGAITAGANVVSAGFGLHASQSQRATSGQLDYDGRRRGFQSAVYRFDDGFTDGLHDRFDAPGDVDKRAIEGFGAPGDSGSSFVRESDGAILGILSNGDSEVYGHWNNYAPLTPAISSRIYAYTGIQAVPEPATLAVCGLGTLALLRRRRTS